MRLLIRTVLGLLLMFIGMAFIAFAIRRAFGGADVWTWLGHIGQGVLMGLAGAALIPNTDIRDFLDRTFSR